MIKLFQPLAIAAIAVSLALPFAAGAQQTTDTVAPEAATTAAPKTAVHAKRQIVVAANPLAAQAGLDVLRAGVHPSQRTAIENEGFVIFEDSALYIFGARTRPRLGTTERPKTVYFLTVLVKTVEGWKFAASHAVNAIG